MAIYGNMIGSSGGILGKTVEIISDDGVDLIGVVVDQEQVLDAKPSDVRIGKKVVSDNGIIEGTNTINYRTQSGSRLIKPGQSFSIPLTMYNQYDYTKFQGIIVLFNSDYSDSAETMAITINDSVFSATNYNKLSDITKNIDTKSIDLNITNNSNNIYSIRYFTYREERRYGYYYAVIELDTGLCIEVIDTTNDYSSLSEYIRIPEYNEAYLLKYYNQANSKWYTDAAFQNEWTPA